jgi:hypothetical protein
MATEFTPQATKFTPMATKFTYKMRSGGKWDVGSGTRPTQTN